VSGELGKEEGTYFGAFLTAFVVCGVFVERVWWDVLFNVFTEEFFSGFVEEVRHGVEV